MITALYTAGKILSHIPRYADYFRPWANPFPKDMAEAKVIVAEITDKHLSSELQLEDFKSSMVDKYLFRPAKSRATNLVPTFYLYPKSNVEEHEDSIRKMVNRIRQSILNYKHTFIAEGQVDAIEQMLLAFPYATGTSYLFTMKIDGKYFGDFQEYQDLFISDAYLKYKKDSCAEDKVCAVTYKKVREVWGRVDTLGFTVNDIAFSRNGFNGADSYKMFPVSPEVVKILEGSKRLIIEKIARNFFGLKYFVLPRLIAKTSDETAEMVMETFLEKCSVSDKNSLQSHFKPLIYNEDIIGEILADEKLRQQTVYYDLFFFQPNNAQFMIKLHVSDVLPSRFRRIMDAKEAIEEKYRLVVDKIPVAKDQLEPFTITFSNIKDYFAEYSKVSGWLFQPYFFKIVEAVFYGNSLNREQLLKAFMDAIRISFKNSKENPYQFSRDVRHTFVILQFFQKLNLTPTSHMNQTESPPVGLTLETFEQQHPEVFSIPVRKAAFYLGCATEKLLEKQRIHLRSEPFRNNLNGLNLDVPQLRKVHLKLIDKISQYNAADHFYPIEREYIENLNVHIAPTLLLDDASLSKTDISYAFAAGMAMQKEFTKEQIRLNQLKKEKEKVNA
jgi:CRISPR-associated Csh1 family protein